MDWIFGRKKSEAKVEDAREVTQDVDGFVMFPPLPDRLPVYHQPGCYPSMPNYPSTMPATGSLSTQPYSYIGSSPHSANHLQKKPNTMLTNPLDSVPFRLSSRLDNSSQSSLPPDIQRIKSFLIDLKQTLNSSDHVYDFNLERSVLREANLFNGL